MPSETNVPRPNWVPRTVHICHLPSPFNALTFVTAVVVRETVLNSFDFQALDLFVLPDCTVKWYDLAGIALGICGQLLLICPVDLHLLQVCLSCLGSVHAEQWHSTPCLCSNWLNIWPVCVIHNRLFALVCALRSASCARRTCLVIGSSIIRGGGEYSKPERGRLIC